MQLGPLAISMGLIGPPDRFVSISAEPDLGHERRRPEPTALIWPRPVAVALLGARRRSQFGDRYEPADDRLGINERRPAPSSNSDCGSQPGAF